ncbi:hypothetical protein [Corynebacterium doosanense]|uniref:hypothetical protein n=1 Tax=Corynebacterium doosanense TaxID=1121358 RepID=UPI0012DED542|nr:hypothetical protein [Corynebacterium doosanense]
MTLLVAVVAALVAYGQLKAMREQTQSSIRPMMGALLKPGRYINEPIRVSINNFGQSIAYDVSLEFDPPLPEPNITKLNERGRLTRKGTKEGKEVTIHYRESPIALLNKFLLNQTVDTWPPYYEVGFDYWVARKDPDLGESAEGIPANTKLKINYRDRDNKWYSDDFALRPQLLAGINFHTDGTRTD